ncbi:MAG: hypothetical protein LCH35_04995 [Bacteroidetes bacterium]|uniref:hypothetical protein n=1 Tax=Flavobacterium sp. TaxID=239 RepID=UPI002FD9433E|nr:hypothetical protein [Bacteroidota bacterium]
MKKSILLIFTTLILLSCKDKSVPSTNIKNDTNLLKERIDSLSSHLLKYKMVEDNFKNEYVINPDSTINIYNKIIQNHPNSFIKDFATSRIIKIKKNIKFWNEIDGWKIDKNGILLKPNYNVEKQVCE